MSNNSENDAGSIISLWRYPVKSMMGEELESSSVTERGILGDRAYALKDPTTGKIASAKNPRKWPNLIDFGAAYSEVPHVGGRIPPVQITTPEGETVTSDQDGIDKALSTALGREATLVTSAPEAPVLEEYWPDMEGLDHRETVTDEDMPSETFFDLAVVHILTTSTINRLRQVYPGGRIEIRRFRPNIVVRTNGDDAAFVENAWVGQTLSFGNEVVLKITEPCPRCVMTTIPQGDLPKDVGILRAIAQNNQTHVGVYASVVRAGNTSRGDTVRLS